MIEIDWIQVLFAGVGGGIGTGISIGIKSLILGAKKRVYRVIFTILAIVVYVYIGILIVAIFPENARIAATVRAFVLLATITIFLPKRKSSRNKKNSNSKQ